MSADVTSNTEQARKDGSLTDMVGSACIPAVKAPAATGDIKPPSPLDKTTSTLSGLLSSEKFPKNDSDVKKNVPFKDDHVELSNKKKRSPCPWQIQPPPRPFKKARYAWQIKNYEHTVSRMRKALAQQPTASSIGKGGSCSDISPELEDSKHCASSAPHYPGLYNNLPAAYSSSFYNPLLRWSKTASAASGVDMPVNRMLHNIFFSGNEPTSGLHPLLMMSLAEGNAAAFNENLACDDLPRDGAPLLLSDVPSGIGVGSPGMQSPPTSDYDSSSDEASLGDDLMPEPQMMSHLPPSYPTMQQQQQQHLMNSPQPHYLSSAQNAHQQMLHQQQNSLSCAQFPHMNALPPRCDSPIDVPINRRMTHIPDDPPSPHLHFEHHTPDHSTPEANLAFHNAMMNCPLSMTNRQLFSLQLHNFCERMQASNNFFPFNQSYQQYRSNCARISEYVDQENSLPTESSEPVIDKDAVSSKVDADQVLPGCPEEDSVVGKKVKGDGREFEGSFYRDEKNFKETHKDVTDPLLVHIRRSHILSLSTWSSEELHQLSTLLVAAHERHRAYVRKEIQITAGYDKDISEEELQSLLDKPPTMFTQDLLTETKLAKLTLTEIRERHDQVVKLEKSIVELNVLFQDLALLVRTQGKTIDDIESHLYEASTRTTEAAGQMQQAYVKARSAMKKKYICLIVITSVVIIFIIMLAYSLIPAQLCFFLHVACHLSDIFTHTGTEAPQYFSTFARVFVDPPGDMCHGLDPEREIK
ncbi:Syntaxin N-terminal domain [Trinorchestia longiramus]|nr:Syntaxin N-terminal domain [Trinorchestia longiramus]